MYDDKKNQGIRLATIILDTYLYGEVDKFDLATRFNVSERTIYRDLGSLSLIIEHKGNSKYGFSTVVEYYKMISFFGLNQYLPEINQLFLKSIPNSIKNESVSIEFNGIEHKIKNYLKKHYDVIRYAIENKRKCIILYKGKNRIVDPYKLTCHNTIWYLKATDKEKLKSFSLNRIEWLDITKDTFSPNESVKKMLSESKDPWASNENFNVLILISTSISHYFKRRDILPNQLIISENIGSLTISCSAMSEKQILPLIQYWLPNIKILEPEWLKLKFEENLRNYINQL
ncbi:WYL domain-containing protein [Proteus alimentorum]|uniref:WYL domain-containing protein n=1 Tax=Proteus alimentorum TaxID=1973495 RepID=A0ABS0IS96_9GAMM|nr:WYL domain-containing protein [Proteus alimentorum]MBG2876692.1 WYL domain-containing protein [Proteus alimentorum]MBG2878480.1 WYL domain-containing protein [Proteus alimentorum]